MKLTATPDWFVGTAWLPLGRVMAKLEPWGADVGEEAAPVIDS
jgi:hypothetical protein